MGKIQKLFNNLVLSIIALSLVSILFLLFFKLSNLITPIGSFLSFLYILYISLKFILRITTFPGSFWYWRRALEKNYSKIISYQLTLRTKELYTFLQDQMTSNSSENSYSLPAIVSTVQKAVENMKTLQKDECISRYQRKFLKVLTNLMSFLDKIKVRHLDRKILLLDYCRELPCSIDNVKFDLETLSLPTEIYKDLEPLLNNGIRLFACLDYMRADLMSKIQCEQVWVRTEDSLELDCIWVQGTNSSAAVILCGSNGGFYEFSYYQSEWLEFYLELGISVFLWNYRGYGRSKGKASLDNLKKDAKSVVNYIRTQKFTKILGIHGESLGGCIATYAANECALDFLVADRTFASLPSVAYYNFGKMAYWIHKLNRENNAESASDFLSAKCFKILLSDPRDNMIHDLSSLKIGVAIKLFAPEMDILQVGHIKTECRKSLCHALGYEDLVECVQALLRLKELSGCFCGIAKSFDDSEYYRKARRKSIELLNSEDEGAKEECVCLCLEKMFSSLCKVDAGGQCFMSVLESSHVEISFIAWLMVLEVWGSSLKTSEEKLSHTKTITAMRDCIQEIQLIQQENGKSNISIFCQVFKDINTVFNALKEILSFIEDRCGPNNSLEMPSERSLYNYQSAGILIPLSCGHSGMLNPSEKALFSKYLQDFLGEKCNN